MNSKTERMPVIGRITKSIHAWAGKIAVACFVLVLASASYAADQVVGNFETGLDSWTDRTGSTSDLGTSTTGATIGSRSMTVLVGPGDDFWKLQHDGQLNLIGATSIAMDVTFVASEWPSDAWLGMQKIALQDHTVWSWQESSSMTATAISGANPPALDGSGNLAWTPSMGNVTWTVSWSLASIGKSNDVYSFFMSLQQPNTAKGSAGRFYIDNIRVRYGIVDPIIVIGNWEGASLDGWSQAWEGSPTLTPGDTNGVTRGSGSLSVTAPDCYWCLQWSGAPLNLSDSSLNFDLTMLASEWTIDHKTKVAEKIAINSDVNQADGTIGTGGGWKEYENLATAINRSDGNDANLSWDSNEGDAEKTYSLDVSNYKTTGATWMQIYITLQGGDSTGHFYFDNARIIPFPPPSRLHVEGNKIKNTDGTAVVLRGVSLIDLAFLESWQGGALNMVNRLTNKEDSSCNSPGWYTKIIRIPIVPTNSDTATWPHRFNPNDPNDPNNEYLYDLLRSVVNRCAQKGVYVVIDWHGIADTNGMVDQTNAFWTYMAPKFADDPHVIFELFNEPMNNIGTDAENWASVKADMQTWINTVRSYAPNTLLFVGTPRYCQIIEPTVDNPVDDPNVVYVTHVYPWHWINENQYYRESITAAAVAHPVILGEWGFSSDASSGTLIGTISDYGQPLKDFVEGLGVGNIAWVASYDWEPSMFDMDWKLLCGEGYMGGFAKDWLYEKRNVDWSSSLAINRCKVTAGKKQGLDAFEASATFAVIPSDILDVNKMDVDIISLVDGNTIYSEDCNLVLDDLNGNNRFIRSYKMRKRDAGRITLLIIDFKKKTLVIKASKINLTGLGCPLRLNVTLGDYVLSGDVNEAVVNGKKPIPIRLMRTYRDTLAVSKASVRNSAKPLRDSFSAKGNITVKDINGPNLANSALVITWADENDTSVQTFTIPAHSFKAAKKGYSYKCKKTRATEAGGGTVSANINMDKCTFTLSVKNTNLSVTSGNVKLGLSFAAFDETADYSIPRKR